MCVLVRANPSAAALPRSTWGRTALHEAIVRGDEGMVRMLLREAPDAAMVPDGYGRQPLLCVDAAEDPGILAALLAAAPQAARVPDKRGSLPIHRAAFEGNVAMLKALVDVAPETAAVQDDVGRTPLFCAADAGKEEAVKFLLTVAPETALVQDDWGETPLHTAIRHSYGGRMNTTDFGGRCARLLVRAVPAAASIGRDGRSGDGCTPLHLAVMEYYFQGVQDILDVAPEAALCRDDSGRSPLTWAMMRGLPRYVEALLAVAPQAAGWVDENNHLPIHFWRSYVEQGAAAAVAEKLVAAAPATAHAVHPGTGATPLHKAAKAGSPGGARVLLAAAPETAVMRDNDGNTPLHVAVRAVVVYASPNIAIVETLATAAPAALLVTNNWGRTPLQCYDSDPDARAALVRAVLAAALLRVRPLAAHEWQLVTPGAVDACLRAALPAVLARSDAEAGRAVSLLSPAGREALQLTVYALRLGKPGPEGKPWLRAALPVELVRAIIVLT